MRSALDQALKVVSHSPRFGGGFFRMLLLPTANRGSVDELQLGSSELTVELLLLALGLSHEDNLYCFVTVVHGSSSDKRFLVSDDGVHRASVKS